MAELEDEVTVQAAEELNDEEVFSATGLQADKSTIVMQENNVYLVLTMEPPTEEDQEEDMSSVGLALLSLNGGHPELSGFAYGMFELLHTDPDLILSAGYEFLTRKAGFQEGTNTLN